MRSSLMYSNATGDTGENLLNTYAQMSDDISFHGSGSVTFVMRLTGSFTGTANSRYGNSIDASLDFYSASRGSDVLGRINLANNNPGSGQARFTAGTNCTGSEGYYALGSVSCTVRSLDAAAIDIELRVTLNNIGDGEVISFYSGLNLQTYGINGGGTDFGNTARLGVVNLSRGLSFSSNSGSFLTQAAPVPEPGTWLMMLAGLGAVGLLAARSRS